MVKMISKKIALLIALLFLGCGFLVFSMMAEPEKQVNANAVTNTDIDKAQDKTINDEDNSGFLNYDVVIGDKDAPIEIIEYAAISCPHCAHFHEDVYPTLKKKYIDTGKAKLVYRNFIFDNPFDVFAASLTRCVAEDKFLPTLEHYFDTQSTWNNIPELRRIFKEEGREAAMVFAQAEVTKIGTAVGITTEQAQACFGNENVINYLLTVRKEAVEKYEVNSTPTIIVDGVKMESSDLLSLETAIEAISNKADNE